MKLFYLLSIALLSTTVMQAQQGLERIIVEKYYVSNEDDKVVDGDGGELPNESVTYRVYVDMLPDYIFQAAFGIPAHQLKIATSTRFFNNQDRGARYPTYTRTQASNNTVMLDSWLSVGAAMKDHVGVLKTNDNGENTIENNDGVLQNQHPLAGIPLITEDGMIAGASEAVTVVGFFDTDLSVLDDNNEAVPPVSIITNDGAWSSLNGSMGLDPVENIVLIGQFTTDGVFEFELNLQIRNQTTFGVETYVANNPTGSEIEFAGLTHIDSLELGSANHDLISVDQYVTVYPNPANSPINVIIDPAMDVTSYPTPITITTMDGKRIYQRNAAGHETILNPVLAPGLYVISVELENKYIYSTQILVTQ